MCSCVMVPVLLLPATLPGPMADWNIGIIQYSAQGNSGYPITLTRPLVRYQYPVSRVAGKISTDTQCIPSFRYYLPIWILHIISSDADPVELLYGSRSRSGSGSRIRKSSIQILIRIQGKNFSQNSIFQTFVEKSILTYWYRTAALYKIGEGPKRTAEVKGELQSSMRMAKVTGGQLRSYEVG